MARKKLERVTDERTLRDKTDGLGDKLTAADLGTPSPQTPAQKPMTADTFAATLSTDLHSGGHPTLADRVIREGFGAYTGAEPAGKKR